MLTKVNAVGGSDFRCPTNYCSGPMKFEVRSP